MKTSLLLSLLLLTTFPTHAVLVKDFRYNGTSFTVNAFQSEAWTSTGGIGVRATLTDNPLRKCYECRFLNYQTGSPNLTSGLQVTAGTDLYLDFFIYPQGHPLQMKSMYIYGADVRNVVYNDVNNTFRVNIRPVAPAVTASHAGGFTAIAGIDFNYYGMGQAITYTPPIIAGNVLWNDVSRAQHPSSGFLLGKAIRVNGVNGQPVALDFLLGNQYAAREKYDLNQTRGYWDGETPASGFNYTLENPSTPVTTSVAGDLTFKWLKTTNTRWSAHDIQAGVFLRFTNIVREAGGVRLHWNPQTTNQYTIQSFSALGGPTNILATNLTGPGYLDTQALTNPARYYRLRGQ